MNIEKLFTVLNNGEWHPITELAAQTETQNSKLSEFIHFLCENGIIEYDQEKGKIKITLQWQNLLPIQEKQAKNKKLDNTHKNPNINNQPNQRKKQKQR